MTLKMVRNHGQLLQVDFKPINLFVCTYPSWRVRAFRPPTQYGPGWIFTATRIQVLIALRWPSNWSRWAKFNRWSLGILWFYLWGKARSAEEA